MKKAVQLVLLCILIPMAGMARDESLEARKKRIMRKYLREAGELSQVDWMVPQDTEEKLVADSEKFQPTDLEFEKHEGIVIQPAVNRRPMMPFSEDGLAAGKADEDLAADPYADPFALAKEDGSDEKDFSRRMRRERPDQKDSRSASDLFSSRANRYESRLDTGRNYRTSMTEQEQTRPLYQRFSAEGQEDLSGRRTSDDRYASPMQSYRTYGSAPEEGMLLPVPTMRRDAEREDRLKQGQIPFKYRRITSENEEQSQSGQLSSPTYRRYTDPLPYQQFKSREKAWDPTADDAYVDELIYKVHQ
jgi:hypothetical protein